jgi:ABC-2 type transport system ATP-binding protein
MASRGGEDYPSHVGKIVKFVKQIKSKYLSTFLALLISSLPVFFASPANAASSVTVSEQRISGAGGVTLDTSLFLPAHLPAPSILLAHGFTGDKNSVGVQAKSLAQHGYVVMTWTARGFGKSSGEISMNSPSGEVADVSKLIDYLGSRKDVIHQGKNDPLVGIAGDSYGGAISLMTAGLDHRIDAVAANITWNNLTNSLFPQNSNDPSYGPYKKFWAGTFFSLASLPNAFGGECGTFAPDWCRAFKDAVATGVPTAADEKLLRASSPSTIDSKISAPTLLMQGEADSLFPLSESIANAQAIHAGHPSLPVAMIWHSGGHDGGTDESKRLQKATSDWFDKYLLKKAIAFPAFQVTDTNGSISLIDSSVIPKLLQSQSLPINPSYSTLAITTPFTALIAPIGGIPGAISSLPGVGSALSLAGNLGGISAAFLPGQSGFLESDPLKRAMTIIGPSQVEVKVSSNKADATLFFSLVVRTASGQTKQPNGIVAPVHLTHMSATGSVFTIHLPSVVMDAAVGDKIAIAISTTDQGYTLPADGRLYTVAIASPLQYSHLEFTSSTSSGALATWPIAALIIVLLAIYIVYLRRPRHNLTALTSSEALVSVNNLSKTYKDGYKAVDGISFEVKRGQVLGLLGPNGAGKTTTLRMMMGLIYPTEGEISIGGKPIYPGSPTLAELGSFVEGSGFLPHLSGRENLELYWKSIGRTDEPFFDEAVAITDLGSALEKKVRSYSQGMRQRLAIAQAMLGLPDLLVLDEPTNGLDPQQIKAMRDVLKDYAKTGRTVIVSSHLLSEVEQTCTHVVLMHRGKLIAAGTMKKILTKAGKKAGSLEEIFIELIGDDLTIGKE